jgi:Spy/CpxP family protein refolding chaperone
MRTLFAAILLVCLALVSPPLPAAGSVQDEGVGERLAERIQDLNLTNEQETKIADIRKECQPKVQEAGKELATVAKEEEQKIREVLTPEQREKVEAFKEERKERRVEGLAAEITRLKDLDLTEAELNKVQEIRKEYGPKIVKALESLKEILTPEQKKAREEALKAGKKHAEVLVTLNLTDDQKQKVVAIGKDVATLVREEMEKVRDVLTDEQQAKLPELKEERRDRVRDRWAHRVANFRELNLTDEQKAKINDIRTEYRPKVHEAGNKLRGSVKEECEMILAVMKV